MLLVLTNGRPDAVLRLPKRHKYYPVGVQGVCDQRLQHLTQNVWDLVTPFFLPGRRSLIRLHMPTHSKCH